MFCFGYYKHEYSSRAKPAGSHSSSIPFIFILTDLFRILSISVGRLGLLKLV